MSPPNLAVAVLLLQAFPPPAPGPTPFVIPFCNDTNSGNFTAGSPYSFNLNTTITDLVAAARTQPFVIAASGGAYALALCRGGVNASACSSCVVQAADELPELCPLVKDATVYYDTCYLRYSDRDFVSDVHDNTPVLEGWNVDKSLDANYAAKLNSAVHALLSDASNGSVGSPARFGTAMAGATEAVPALYGMAQCTPDLSPEQCGDCLREVVNVTRAHMDGHSGGRVLGVRCGVRYENYPFVTAAAATTTDGGSQHLATLILAIGVPLIAVVVLGLVLWFAWKRRLHKKDDHVLCAIEQSTQSRTSNKEEIIKAWKLEENSTEFRLFEFSQIEQATNNFAIENKLGEGGFGPVYKGKLQDGTEIAAKTLSAHSSQGLSEFKTEIQLIAKLQHTNLVRLLGCCVEGDEKMLVYEFLPNKSLDFFIFDSERRKQLSWDQRLCIIEGIAQGLLYLHRLSRVRIVHRDMKASNILLDHDMIPKISDFGMARIFGTNQIQETTTKLVGTYGYMAPEYASEGYFSTKSDVYSFGVLVLEIISGQRNSGFHFVNENFLNLVGFAWQMWKEGRWLEVVDASLGQDFPHMEVMRCIKIGLLCVEEDSSDRPSMSDVILMLSRESTTVPEPKQPAYSNLKKPGGFEELTTYVTGDTEFMSAISLSSR